MLNDVCITQRLLKRELTAHVLIFLVLFILVFLQFAATATIFLILYKAILIIAMMQ
jgi:hypothetical protein